MNAFVYLLISTCKQLEPMHALRLLYDSASKSITMIYIPQSLKAELVQVKSECELKQKEMKELEDCLEAVMPY
jgi:hypothetical protein